MTVLSSTQLNCRRPIFNVTAIENEETELLRDASSFPSRRSSKLQSL